MSAGRIPTTANSPLTAKGDLFTYSTAPARLAVGNNGETLVADSSTATGLSYQANWAAGKNKIINGNFGIWQRGTSFSSPANQTYTADRFLFGIASGSGATYTVAQQTFTAGTAPVAGYEGQYFLRFNTTVAGTMAGFIEQRIEDVRTFAGQTITVSFWAKADSSRTMTFNTGQIFGSGGSSAVYTGSNNAALTTSWQRFSATISVASISGKTIGAGSYLSLFLSFPSSTTQTIDIWGVQVEAGSVATAFQTATGTIQGELSAAQRYYYRVSDASSTYWRYGQGNGESTTVAQIQFQCPTTMRVRPTAMEYSNFGLVDGSAAYTGGTWAINTNRSTSTSVTADYTHGSAALTQKQSYGGISAGTASSYIAFTAEL